MPTLKDGTGTAIRIVGSDIYIDLDLAEGSFTLAELNTALSDATLVDGGSASFSTLAELNTIVTDATLVDEGHTHTVSDVTDFSHTHTASEVTDFRSSVGDYVDAVSGGAGFTNVSGAVTLDVSTGRAFHHTMTGNITSLAFSNIPTSTLYESAWTWVLDIDATGGYTLSSTPTVTWVGGSDFTDLDLSANARNIVSFWRVGGITHASLVSTGTIRLDPYSISFPDDGTALIIVKQDETLGLGDVTHLEADGTAGTGTLAYEKNGVTASGSTAFVDGDVLGVILTGGSAASTVSIPRFI